MLPPRVTFNLTATLMLSPMSLAGYQDSSTLIYHTLAALESQIVRRTSIVNKVT